MVVREKHNYEIKVFWKIKNTLKKKYHRMTFWIPLIKHVCSWRYLYLGYKTWLWGNCIFSNKIESLKFSVLNYLSKGRSHPQKHSWLVNWWGAFFQDSQTLITAITQYGFCVFAMLPGVGPKPQTQVVPSLSLPGNWD